jgi:cytochrome c biogenesis protein CcmG/thiol:disulfide interchange protein DsbE
MIALTNRQWNLLFAGVLLVGSLFIVATRVGPSGGAAAAPAPVSADTAPGPLPDRPAPDFTLLTLDGTTVTLSKLKGQVALINIWATWCPPCRAEMPTIQATYEQYREQGFTVLAVDLQEDPRTVAGFMREFKLTFPALLDTDGAVSQAYQASALPSSFFVDRKGIIRAVYRGPMPRGVIAGTIEQLLQEGT